LEEACLSDLSRQVRGQTTTKAGLLREEKDSLLPIPEESFEAVRIAQATANSLSLVRFQTNDYSVPTRYAHRSITIVASVDAVRLICNEELIASHSRQWGREQHTFDPVHYLALLETKPGGFDHAKPLEEWELPVCFGILRRKLNAEGHHPREFIRVLRLLENHSLTALKAAVQFGLERNIVDADALRLIVEYQQEEPVGMFLLNGRPHLKQVRVATTTVSAYQSLLNERLAIDDLDKTNPCGRVTRKEIRNDQQRAVETSPENLTASDYSERMRENRLSLRSGEH